MHTPTHNLNDVDLALANCICLFARRGAAIRAELRERYGVAEGDRRMTELAREAERRLWPEKINTPTTAEPGGLAVVGASVPDANAAGRGKDSTT